MILMMMDGVFRSYHCFGLVWVGWPILVRCASAPWGKTAQGTFLYLPTLGLAKQDDTRKRKACERARSGRYAAACPARLGSNRAGMYVSKVT